MENKISGEVWMQDCHHHLQNIWFKAMETALTSKLNEILRSSLEEIAPELRVTCSFSAISRAYDMGFSRCTNDETASKQVDAIVYKVS